MGQTALLGEAVTTLPSDAGNTGKKMRLLFVQQVLQDDGTYQTVYSEPVVMTTKDGGAADVSGDVTNGKLDRIILILQAILRLNSMACGLLDPASMGNDLSSPPGGNAG